MRQVTLQIQGMSCGHCLNAVNRALNGVSGATVKQVQIGRAEVEVADSTAVEQLVAAVTEAGYPATAVVAG